MAWMWARLKTRTTRLATFQGGFQAFSDLFADRLRREGVHDPPFHPRRAASSPLPDGGLRLSLADGPQEFDGCLSTTSPALAGPPGPSPARRLTCKGCSTCNTWARWC